MKNERLDVLIAGGGVNGAGVVRDLALRNVRGGGRLRIGLVEKGHFASGTSSKNSHLIHGGLRYLKYLDFKLVREALRERAVLLEIAPHLVEPLHFLIPFESSRDRLFYRTGLSVYDWLAGEHRIANHRAVPLKEMARVEPDLKTENFVAGACFLDCRVQSARLVLENIFEAIRHGAAAVNYIEVVQRTRLNDGGWEVRLRDRESGEEFETRAGRMVDATGAWSGEDSVRLVRGSHLILPRMNRSDTAVAYFEPAGRIVFFIPWGSSLQCTLVGTTDVDHEGGPDAVRISNEEVEYLMSVARRVFRDEAIGEPISAFSSLRPLVRDRSASATKTSREHRIWEENGVLHIAGGKYTTYRLISQEVCDLFCREAAPSLQNLHLSGETPVEGNSRGAIRELLDAAPDIASRYGVRSEEVQRLVKTYGVQAENVLAYGDGDAESAQIAYAAGHEMIMHLRDLLCISTTWGYERKWNDEGLMSCAKSLGLHLAWSERQLRHEVDWAAAEIHSLRG